MLVISDGWNCQGANSYGQLGHGGVEDRTVPRLCDTAALRDRAVQVVTGGGGHTVVITGKFLYDSSNFNEFETFIHTDGVKSGTVDRLFSAYPAISSI